MFWAARGLPAAPLSIPPAGGTRGRITTIRFGHAVANGSPDHETAKQRTSNEYDGQIGFGLAHPLGRQFFHRGPCPVPPLRAETNPPPEAATEDSWECARSHQGK